ncbi:hypothetical protein CW740_00210 [Kangiella profundi]|uniref:Uncharacterized protein n=1 Tax=Kangiella profundi TaxID=1561924 RepID=A0A2K9A4S2_9GAMM|nr:hypothetical protein [Kangiella profundi]AUD77740.1 hypothetical protein CW740_00210 [Kangiella profundi]GGE93040.1 hypothetical protein GCM10011356_03870 [Kangiella profundi]
MFSMIKKLFAKDETPKIELQHELFGHMVFVQDGQYWEASQGSIFHCIPGNEDGPNNNSVEFISNKMACIDKYWEICSPTLLSVAHDFDSIDKNLTAKELFKVTAISVNSDDNKDWEVCFETEQPNKWIYIGLHFENEELVANDINT